MEKKTIKIKGLKYLTEHFSETPSHCLINKGITGCGGTTLELHAKRNSIILCPTINLVMSKSNSDYLGVTGKTKNSEIDRYVNDETILYKKIIATYDSLERLMAIIRKCDEYFLLIDEYHLLFNDYTFRNKAISFILDNFGKFDNWAFMTATPLKDEFILKELEDVDQITYEWEDAVPVNIIIRDTHFIQKELLNYIDTYKDRNLHIFLNSVSTITKIADKLEENSYRVVCSESIRHKAKNFAKVTDPIKKINFYTSCAFEGCDIYDEDGFCVIVCDTNIATTVLDISTKIRQVCGRLRDSKYKNKCHLILNTSKHRYAGISEEKFKKLVKESEELGRLKYEAFVNGTDLWKKSELRSYTKEGFGSMYLNKVENEIKYDENLKKLDIYNYKLIKEIYSTSISVLHELENSNFIPAIEKSTINKGLSWVVAKLKELDKEEFTYQELQEIFEPLFAEHNLKWNKNTSIKNFFPDFTKRKKTINGKQDRYYNFELS